MTPQVQTLLTHLQKHGSISQAEAGLIYKIRSLPRRISDLKELGHNITRELKKDATGQRYARYTLVAPLKAGDRVRIINEGEESSGGIYYKKGDTGVIETVYPKGVNPIQIRLDNSQGRSLTRPFISAGDFEVIA